VNFVPGIFIPYLIRTYSWRAKALFHFSGTDFRELLYGLSSMTYLREPSSIK
jgi:hypothetical protein